MTGKLMGVVSLVIAIGSSACSSEGTPSEPIVGADQAQVVRGTYTAVDLGTQGGDFSRAQGINPGGQVVGVSRR